MEPINNHQNHLAHSSTSEQTQNQATTLTAPVLDSVVSATLATTVASTAVPTPVNSGIADPIQMAYKRKLGILTHSICQRIVLKFLNGEMALTLSCKHFTSNREEMSSLFRYEKLCASGTPPQHDPFRPLIQAAIPERLMQQSLWQRLWIAREAGNEPWKKTHYYYVSEFGEIGLRDGQFNLPATPDLEKFYGEVCRSGPNSPIMWPGRRFEVHLIDNDFGYKDSILSIIENGRKISEIHIEPNSPLGVSSKDGIIGLVVGTDSFYVWKPDLDSLRK